MTKEFEEVACTIGKRMATYSCAKVVYSTSHFLPESSESYLQLAFLLQQNLKGLDGNPILQRRFLVQDVHPWNLLPSPQPLRIPSVHQPPQQTDLEIKNWKLKTFTSLSLTFLVNKHRFVIVVHRNEWRGAHCNKVVVLLTPLVTQQKARKKIFTSLSVNISPSLLSKSAVLHENETCMHAVSSSAFLHFFRVNETKSHPCCTQQCLNRYPSSEQHLEILHGKIAGCIWCASFPE